MVYMIFDCTANLVEGFDDRDTALEYLAELVRIGPDPADEVVLLTADENGDFVGEAIFGSDVAAPA